MGHDDDQVEYWLCDQWKALGIGDGQDNKALAEPQKAIELNSNWSALIRSIGFVFGSRNAL